VDAIPTRLGASVHALLERGAPVYVPGHGGTADAAGLQPYVSLLDDVEAAARRAIEQGVPAAQAAESYRPPAALGEWVMFSPAYWRVAFQAWERELRGTNPWTSGARPLPELRVWVGVALPTRPAGRGGGPRGNCGWGGSRRRSSPAGGRCAAG